MRTAEVEHELAVETYEYFADRDPLTRAVLERMLAGVSTRRFGDAASPSASEVEQASTSTSKTLGLGRSSSAPAGAGRADEPPARGPAPGGDDARRAGAQGPHDVVALGITTEGVKVPLGLWEGSTENATVATRAARRPHRAGP